MASKPEENTAKAPRAKYVRYSEATAEAICEALAQGKLWSHIASTEEFPSARTFHNWMRDRPAFRIKVNAAKAAGADLLAERALVVAEATTKETVTADRLRVDTLMKHAAGMAPQTWGRKAGEAKAGAEAPREIVVYIREFVPVARPDGTLFTREILPDGRFRDYDQ